MNFPPPPWRLNGFAIQTFQLTKISEARIHVPQQFDIVSIIPGSTASGIYLARYGYGSTLEYSEFICIKALVRYKTKFGFWCSSLFVDNIQSVLGGQEIWKLPKKEAQFIWQNHSDGVAMATKNLSVCILINNLPAINFSFYKPSKIGIKLRFPVPLLTEYQNKIYHSKMKLAGKILLGSVNMEIIPSTINKNIFISNAMKITSCYYDRLEVTALAPTCY